MVHMVTLIVSLVHYMIQSSIGITVNGQLSLCMLAERLPKDRRFELIKFFNTDGITVYMPRSKKEQYDTICKPVAERG